MRLLLIALLVFFCEQTSVRSQDLQKPKYEERINEFYLKWQELPERKSYWAHVSMDSRTPDRQTWFEYLYRVALTNNPSSGRRIRVDGLRSQFQEGALVDMVHDLVLLGKHLSLMTPGGGAVTGHGIRTKVLDQEDKDSVVTSSAGLYPFDPFWVALGSFTTVKRSQNVEFLLQSWSKKTVIEEGEKPDGTYVALVVTANGVEASEITFSKDHDWMPIEKRSYWDYKNDANPKGASSVKKADIKKWKMISHTKTEWSEVTQSDEQKWMLPKKYVMWQWTNSVAEEKDCVIQVGGWKFDKQVASELFQEESFATTCQKFSLEEGKGLFEVDEKGKSRK